MIHVQVEDLTLRVVLILLTRNSADVKRNVVTELSFFLESKELVDCWNLITIMYPRIVQRRRDRVRRHPGIAIATFSAHQLNNDFSPVRRN